MLETASKEQVIIGEHNGVRFSLIKTMQGWTMNTQDKIKEQPLHFENYHFDKNGSIEVNPNTIGIGESMTHLFGNSGHIRFPSPNDPIPNTDKLIDPINYKPQFNGKIVRYGVQKPQ